MLIFVLINGKGRISHLENKLRIKENFTAEAEIQSNQTMEQLNKRLLEQQETIEQSNKRLLEQQETIEQLNKNITELNKNITELKKNITQLNKKVEGEGDMCTRWAFICVEPLWLNG
jgi:methyl-accepting chemotaxis protein